MRHTGTYGSAQRYLAATPDGRSIAAIVDDGQARVWHADSRDAATQLEGHSRASFIAISNDGRVAVTSAFHGNGVRLWDARTGKFLRDLWPESVSAMSAFTPDGRSLLVSESRRYRLLDIESGKTLWEQDRTDASDASGLCAISPDGRLFAVTPSNHEIHLLDTKTFRELAILDHPDRSAYGPIRFSSDGHLLTRCAGQSIEVWDMKRLTEKLSDVKLAW